jgi:hypothetical protein
MRGMGNIDDSTRFSACLGLWVRPTDVIGG